MEISFFDIVGITFFLVVAYLIYNKGWFFSFYSFFKFILVFLISFSAGLVISQKIPHLLPLNNLQFSLLIQGVLFVILWKIVSFKKVFFIITDKVIPVNRFVFIHHIDRVLNIFPSIVVSFFFTFFIFTTLVASSGRYPMLQRSIESSKIVKELAYNIYFASINPSGVKLFEGVAFELVPSTAFYGLDNPNLVEPVPSGGGTSVFTPDIIITPSIRQPVFTPPTPVPVQNQVQPTSIPPTAPPTKSEEFRLFVFPTSIPTQVPPTQPPAQPIDVPTTTPPIVNQNPASPIISVFTPPTVSVSTVEQDIFRLTNVERVKNGLPPFVLDNALSSIARAHSLDMNTRNYFSHVSPDGVDVSGRMRNGGINATAGGENIAGGPTADIIVNNWMNSPGHRANILNPVYNKIGVGVAISSDYGFLATQVFTN